MAGCWKRPLLKEKETTTGIEREESYHVREAAMGIELATLTSCDGEVERRTAGIVSGRGIVAANGGDVLKTAAGEGDGGEDGNCAR